MSMLVAAPVLDGLSSPIRPHICVRLWYRKTTPTKSRLSCLALHDTSKADPKIVVDVAEVLANGYAPQVPLLPFHALTLSKSSAADFSRPMLDMAPSTDNYPRTTFKAVFSTTILSIPFISFCALRYGC